MMNNITNIEIKFLKNENKALKDKIKQYEISTTLDYIKIEKLKDDLKKKT